MINWNLKAFFYIFFLNITWPCCLIATLTPTARRWQRRQRAKARCAWFLHRTGRVRLTVHQLGELHHTLAQHHSKDPIFLEKIRRAMAQQWTSWTCPCGRRNKKSAVFCGTCGMEWRASYADPGAGAGAPWPRDGDWTSDWRSASLSPRRQPSRGRPRNDHAQGGRGGKGRGHDQGKARGKGGKQGPGAGKGQGAGQGQPAGKGQAQPTLAPASEPTWSAPNAPPVTAPQPPQPPRESLAEDTAVRNLIRTLKRNPDALTPELQDALSSVSIIEQKNNGKTMHNAVTRWTKAQNAHAAAIKARSTLHCAWRNFVAEAVQRWETYANDFSRQDQELQTSINNTKETLVAAQTELETVNAQVSRATGAAPTEAPVEPTADAMNVEDEAARLDQASTRINEGLTTMISNLGSVRRRAEDVIDLEAPPPAVRARGEDPGVTGEPGASFTSPGA